MKKKGKTKPLLKDPNPIEHYNYLQESISYIYQ